MGQKRAINLFAGLRTSFLTPLCSPNPQGPNSIDHKVKAKDLAPPETAVPHLEQTRLLVVTLMHHKAVITPCLVVSRRRPASMIQPASAPSTKVACLETKTVQQAELVINHLPSSVIC